VASRPATTTNQIFSRIYKSMWNDIPADELKELMDEIDAVELHPDEPN